VIPWQGHKFSCTQHGSFRFIFLGLKSREKWNGWLVMYSRNDPCGVQSMSAQCLAWLFAVSSAAQVREGRAARPDAGGSTKGKANPLQGTEITPTRRLGVGALGSFQLAISSGFPQEVISAEYIPSARMPEFPKALMSG
jgi:hypothetical protein